ncbi:MAG: GerMN domain-containing protein [Peptococcaceae bacterium]|nr:GerMN domain-containing protein [Peptococcaceae bacterium]
MRAIREVEMMKRSFVILILFFSLISLSSCSKNPSLPGNNTGNAAQTENTSELSIKAVFPFTENTKYSYEGKGNKYASYTVYTDFIEGDRIQQRFNNGGTETVKVFENKNGELTLLLSKGESYYRENLTKSSSENGEILLKEPLKKGTSWVLPDNRKRYISNEGVPIKTSSGDYQALEVTTENEQGKTLDYYAPSVGLVKTEYISNELTVSSTLAKLEKNILFQQTVQFYYPNIQNNKLYAVKKTLSFHTNDLTKQVLEKEYKNIPQGDLAKVLSAQTKINSLYLNKDGMVYIDFSKELISEMNAGSGYESMILQSITNTIGTYYGAEKVYITVEGKPYASGHFEMKKGEAFKVNLTNSIQRS